MTHPAEMAAMSWIHQLRWVFLADTASSYVIEKTGMRMLPEAPAVAPLLIGPSQPSGVDPLDHARVLVAPPLDFKGQGRGKR